MFDLCWVRCHLMEPQQGNERTNTGLADRSMWLVAAEICPLGRIRYREFANSNDPALQ